MTLRLLRYIPQLYFIQPFNLNITKDDVLNVLPPGAAPMSMSEYVEVLCTVHFVYIHMFNTATPLTAHSTAIKLNYISKATNKMGLF